MTAVLIVLLAGTTIKVFVLYALSSAKNSETVRSVGTVSENCKMSEPLITLIILIPLILLVALCINKPFEF